MRLLYDCSHTSHYTATTGIQRVVRELYRLLYSRVSIQPTCFDPYAKYWRALDNREQDLLDGIVPKTKCRKISNWTSWQKIRGISTALTKKGYRTLQGEFDALLIAETFDSNKTNALLKLKSLFNGPKIAIFYDLIPLALPSHTSQKAAIKFSSYLQQLLQFDAIAAISEDSKTALLEYWQQNYPQHAYPKVEAIPLGTDLQNQRPTPSASTKCPTILFVSSLANRKNHLALLDAAELLWQQGFAFQLDFIGTLLNKEIGKKIVSHVNALKTTHHRPVRWLGPVSDEQLQKAYQECTFTVYPSRYEGFGLPVIESLSYGKPCVCTPGGALKEVVANGGCHLVDDFTPEAIATGIKKLLTDPAHFQQLQQEAIHMTFRTWDDYANNLLAFIEELRPQCLG